MHIHVHCMSPSVSVRIYTHAYGNVKSHRAEISGDPTDELPVSDMGANRKQACTIHVLGFHGVCRHGLKVLVAGVEGKGIDVNGVYSKRIRYASDN
jgi:hypothetical protein